VLPCIRRYQRRLRALRELQKAVEELEKMDKAYEQQSGGNMQHPVAQRNKQLLKKYKSQLKVKEH
jgi:hypothetical protein